MTITREQLELAAKAAGLLDAVAWSDKANCFVYDRYDSPFYQRRWNPLTDHGQLHDLAMACRINIDPIDNRVRWHIDDYHIPQELEADCQDFSVLAEAVITAAAEQQLAKEEKA